MEDEIEEKLEKIYNKYIMFEVETLGNNNFKINASIKISDIKRGIIRIGFTFDFKYDKELTIDANVFKISAKIAYNIKHLFKEE